MDGGTATKAFYFRSEADALTAKRAIAAELRAEAATPLQVAVERYLVEELRDNRRRKASTVAEARARLNPLIRLAPDTIREVSPDHIRERLAQLPSPASQRGTLGRMVDFFNFAKAAGLVDVNPCDGIEVRAKAPKGKPTLTRSEARRLDVWLWAEVEGDGVEAEVALAALLLLYLGLRRGELLKLQVRDVDTVGRVLSVERDGKTDRALRDVEVPARLAAALSSRVEGRPSIAWLWPSPKAASGHRGSTWLLKGVRRVCRAAEVVPVCPQGLRATHGKLARLAGVTAHAVQAQLGHEDVRTSVESYITPAADRAARRQRAQGVFDSERDPRGRRTQA